MFKTILVPIDPDAFPARAMETAVSLALLHAGRIVALSVAEPRQFHSSEADAAREGAAVEAGNRAFARDSVSRAASIARTRGVPCETLVSQSNVPSDEIVDVAARMDCDVIVLESRGRMGVLDTVFQESETQSLLRKTRLPVLVLPRDGDVPAP